MLKQRAESFLFTNTGCFYWKIHDYLKASQPKRSMESPIFSVDKHKCRLLLYPHGDTQATAGWVSLYLRCEGNIKPPGVETTFKFDFLDEREEVISVTTRNMEFNHIYKKSDKGWGSSKIVRKDQMQNYLRNGTLHIRVTIEVHTVVTHAQTVTEEIVSLMPDDHTIGEDMGKLLHECPTDVDFVFEEEGGREVVSAHKMMLSVRSDVFRAMFRGGMKEMNDKEIVLSDAPANVFRSIVDYIYTGKCDVNMLRAFPMEFLYLVDKYDLKGLRQQCEKELVTGMGADSVLPLLSVANTYDLPTLRDVAWSVLSRNFKYIKSTHEFKNMALTEPTLFEDIIDRMINNASSAMVSPAVPAAPMEVVLPKKVGFVRKHFGKKHAEPALGVVGTAPGVAAQ